MSFTKKQWAYHNSLQRILFEIFDQFMLIQTSKIRWIYQTNYLFEIIYIYKIWYDISNSESTQTIFSCRTFSRSLSNLILLVRRKINQMLLCCESEVSKSCFDDTLYNNYFDTWGQKYFQQQYFLARKIYQLHRLECRKQGWKQDLGTTD